MPIQFNDDLEVNEITRHSRATLDELFWEEDEIAEFRHYAFLVACGLEKEEDDDEDEIVSLEGFQLSEEEKSVETKMHSSLPVIDIDFDILESKQKCLKRTKVVVVEQPAKQEKPMQPTQLKVKNRISDHSTTTRVAKFQDLLDRHRNDGQSSSSATNSPFRTAGKKTLQRSPIKNAPRDETVEERVEKEEEEGVEDSRRKIIVQDRLRIWMKRDEVHRLSPNRSDRLPVDIPSPPPSKLLETSSPYTRRQRINEKKLRKSTRSPRPPFLDLDNADQSPNDVVSLHSQTPPPEAIPKLNLDESQGSAQDSSRQNSSNPGLESETPERFPIEAPTKKRTSRSKSPRPGVGNTKSHDTPRSGKKKLPQEAANAGSGSETPKQGNTTTPNEITTSQLSERNVDPIASPEENPMSRKKKIAIVGKKKEKSLSLSSVDTSSTKSTSKSPKEVANDYTGSDTPTKGNATTSDDITSTPLSEISVDPIASPDGTPRSRKKKSTATVSKKKEKSLSLSSVDTTSTVATSKTPKEVANDDAVSATPRKGNPRTSDDIPSTGLSEICVDPIASPVETLRSSKKKTTATVSKKKEKSLSLSSVDTTSTISTTDKPPKSPRKRSPKPRVSSDELAIPRASQRSSTSRPPSLSSLDADSLHSMQEEPTQKSTKNSSKLGKMSESLSPLEMGSTHSSNESPKSPKRPSSTSKRIVEPASPGLSKRTSSKKKAEESEAVSDGRSIKKKSLSLKASKAEEIIDVSFHSDDLSVDNKSPSAAKKKPATASPKAVQDRGDSPKSSPLRRGTTVPTKRHSLPVPVSLNPTPTLTVTIRRGKKKEETSHVRRKIVRRSLSSCLVHVNQQDVEWRATFKRSNSVKLPKAIS